MQEKTGEPKMETPKINNTMIIEMNRQVKCYLIGFLEVQNREDKFDIIDFR
jgi:hypothetical protein